MFLSHSKKINNEKGDNELQGIESGYLNKLDTYSILTTLLLTGMFLIKS